MVLKLTNELPVKELDKFVLAIGDFSKTNMTSSEANTKKKIVERMLEILGWDTSSEEVMLEYPIKIGSTAKYVDYALMLEKKPVVLVEAKPFDVALSDDDSAQIISYGRVEDVQWVILTNGRKLKVFDTKEGKTEKECLVTEIDLMSLPMQANDLSLISRESILTGDIEAAAKRLAATKNAINNLKMKQKEIAEEFKKILLKITGKEVERRVEDLSSQLVVQAIQLFEMQVKTVAERTYGKEVQLVTKKQLVTKSAGKVVVCPSRIEGVEFLKKYNAWGFVNMREEEIPYFALYVGRPESSILYFGEIESITKPLKSKEDLVKIQDIETFEPGKRVIHLKLGTLVKLLDPIPLKNRRFVPKSRFYTTLEKLTQASYIEDLRVAEITVEQHLEKIKNAKLKKMALELRNAILQLSNDIREEAIRTHVLFRTSVNFAGLYAQPRGFWLSVRLVKNELNMQDLDARPQRNPKWTDIRVNEETSLDSLFKAAKLAYQRTV
ncbi:type I restriction enzyme HsdR N-terminal domain-containing protein [Candidatus Bathyarchaeota archaeon]|nr:type I restriction enzyme HsdR N-terminal domain-containing protein [Candidatus Bathyarchaeota archaeon]